MSNPTQQAVARVDTSTATIEQYKADFAQVLPSHIPIDQFMRITTGVFRTNKKLQRILETNPGSVLKSVLECARLGLELGVTYHLLPFGSEVEGTPDYKGLIELMHRAGAVSAVKVELVYANDVKGGNFHWVPGEMDYPHHTPDWFGDRGEMVGAYAYARMKDGGYSQVVLMTKDEIETIRDNSPSKGKSPLWQDHPKAAWRKTVIRQLEKYVPTSPEFLTEQLKAIAKAQADTRVGHTSIEVGRPVGDKSLADVLETVDGEIVDVETGEVVTA